MRMRSTLLSVAPAIGSVAFPGVTYAEAPTSVQGAHSQHCIGPAQSLGRATPAAECFDTYAEVLEVFGVTSADPHVTPATVTQREAEQMGQLSSRSSFPYRALATHYSDTAPTGDSLTISGTDCAGGGVVLTGAFSFMDNRVRETRHFACGRIKHFATQNFTGDFQATEAPYGFDRSMNTIFRNDVSSISYYGPEQ